MSFFKKLWNNIKEPNNIWLALFCILFIFILADTILLVIFAPNNIINYFFYIVASIGLVYFIYLTIFFIYPKTKSKITNFMQKHKITNKMLENKDYKTLVYAVVGFIINIAYVAIHLTLGIITASIWYITISIFYFVLITIKAIIFYKAKKFADDKLSKLKTYRNIGALFIVLTLSMSGIAVLINKNGYAFKFAGVMIYVIAFYTFYKIVSAIVQIIKYKNNENYYIKSINCTNLVSALYSIWVLQVAMFQAFSANFNSNLYNNITGGVVAALILSLSTYMVIKSSNALELEKSKITTVKKETDK